MFDVIIECGLSAVTLAASSTVTLGVTTQPFNIAFTQTQGCGVVPTLSPVLSFLTISGTNVQVAGATVTNVGTHNVTLTSTLNA